MERLVTRITGAISDAIAGGGKGLTKGTLDAAAALLACINRQETLCLAEQVKGRNSCHTYQYLDFPTQPVDQSMLLQACAPSAQCMGAVSWPRHQPEASP